MKTVLGLKRFAQNLKHRFGQNASQRSNVARVSPFADASGKRQNALCAALLVSIGYAPPAMAEDEPLTDAVLIELNAAKTSDGACALTFLILNGHASPITKAVYETVLFDTSGQVDRLTLFDFGTLPPGRPRVRQFSVSGVTCDGLSQVLINGAHTCDADALPATACEADLTVGTRTGIDVIG